MKHSQNCQILSGSLSKSCENAKHISAKVHSKLCLRFTQKVIFLLNMKSREFYINWSNVEYVPHGSMNLILAPHSSFYLTIGLICVVQTEPKIPLNMVIIWLNPKNQLQSWIRWASWTEENLFDWFQILLEVQVLHPSQTGIFKKNKQIIKKTHVSFFSCILVCVVPVVACVFRDEYPEVIFIHIYHNYLFWCKTLFTVWYIK